MSWNITPLDATSFSRSSLKKSQFDSGYEELNEYLKKYSMVNHRNKVTRVFVAMAQGSEEIAGYYTSNTSIIVTSSLPEEERGGFPKETPALLIGRLAVDKSEQGKGLGKKLLRHAFEYAVDISQKTGVYAVRIDAKNEQTKKYYKDKFRFQEFLDAPFSLFLPLRTIEVAIANQQRQT